MMKALVFGAALVAALITMQASHAQQAAAVSSATAVAKISPPSLYSTRIVTKDVPGLARFYETVTRIAPVSPSGTPSLYVEFRTAGSILAISDEGSVAKNNAGAAIAGANHSMIIEFEVADVVAERARLDKVVKQWVMEPTLAPWGNRTMLFRDPDGNLINFFTPVGKQAK
jgi:uncharacterized glyoxalase superfamily protein PhnB